MYRYFWTLALLLGLLAFLTKNLELAFIDINVHDTYYVISYFSFFTLLGLIYLSQGLGYWIVQALLKKEMIPLLTFLHTTLLLLSLILIAFSLLYFENVSPSLFENNYFTKDFFLLLSLFLLVVIAQPFYFLNVLLGLFSKKQSDWN